MDSIVQTLLTSANGTEIRDVSSPSEQIFAFAILVFGCLCFGTMFLPLKRFECGDGFFVQFLECGAVFAYGIIINLIRGLPKFNLIAAIGGFLYATGNCASVPIVKSELGVGVGMLIWSTVQIVEGWCVGRFGLFGTHAQKSSNELMNYIGLALTIASGIMFAFVRNESEENEVTIMPSKKKNFISTTKFFFIGLSVFLGLVHGLMLTPIVYVQENDANFTGNVLDYLFSFFSSTFFFSTLYFAIYAMLKKNRPFVEGELVLPSLAYGILWASGMTSFIVATSVLSQTISWPITARVPAIIGCVIDVIFFKAVRGARNIIILVIGISIGIAGVILVGLSSQL